jgi:hypothetical protein
MTSLQIGKLRRHCPRIPRWPAPDFNQRSAPADSFRSLSFGYAQRRAGRCHPVTAGGPQLAASYRL